MLYEKGLPVVQLETEWHVDVQQKVPVNIERDSVSGAYEKAICVAVLNEMENHITEAIATKSWVTTALGDKRVKASAVKTVVTARFGEEAVIYDVAHVGANKECTAKGKRVVTGGAFSKEAWANIKKAKKQDSTFMPTANEVCPTDFDVDHTKDVPERGGVSICSGSQR